MTLGASRAPLLPRIVGALLLRRSTFADVAKDLSAGFQGGLLIVIVGMFEATAHAAVHERSVITTEAVLVGVVAAMIGWVLWSGILWIVASRGFGYDVDLPSAVRVVAFAHSPALLYGIGAVIVPREWVAVVFFATLAWFVAALLVGIRAWLDVPLARASLVFVVSFALRVFVEEVFPWAFRLVPLGT